MVSEPVVAPPQGGVTPSQRAEWVKDSAKYVADSTKYAHDQQVRDSISRTVITDSLYRLRRAMLVAANPVPLEGAAECEQARLMARYGYLPSEMAINRMEDTLWKPGEEAAVRKLNDRLHSMTVEEMATLGIGTRKCGRIIPILDEFDGARLNDVGPAPTRPKRPPQ